MVWFIRFTRGTKVSKKEKKMVDQIEHRLRNMAIDAQIYPLLDEKRLKPDFERNLDEAMVLIRQWKKKYGEVV